jgi:4-alpha-glucanotransferase
MLQARRPRRHRFRQQTGKQQFVDEFFVDWIVFTPSSMPRLALHLQVNYVTRGDAYLIAVGPDPAFGAGDVQRALRLRPIGEGNWYGSVCIEGLFDAHREQTSSSRSIEYKYVVVSGAGEVENQHWEASQTVRSVLVDETLWHHTREDVVDLFCYDSWRAAQSSVFASAAFVDSIFGNVKMPKTTSWLQLDDLAMSCCRWNDGSEKDSPVQREAIRIRFVAYVPRLEPNHRVYVNGAPAELGAWRPAAQLPMVPIGSCLYACTMTVSPSSFPVEYRYTIAEADEPSNLICRESGSNRWVRLPRPCPQARFLQVDDAFRYATVWKGAGVAVPLLSLRSQVSFGVGDFGDLKRFIDWVAAARLKLVQLLPIHDTGEEASPYSALSVYAIHPIYMSLPWLVDAVPSIDLSFRATMEKRIDKEGKEYNANTEVAYASVLAAKERLIHEIYEHGGGSAMLDTPSFQHWQKQNAFWLPVYALYKAIRAERSPADGLVRIPSEQWQEHGNDAALVAALTSPSSPYYDRVRLICFTQYHLHLQLKSVSDYAKTHGIALKGDLPIGVTRDSADTWQHPDYFRMDRSIGAPASGTSSAQNWDFPVYCWEEMAKDGYRWWRQRMQHMSQYFQAFRIDHVLGLFRVWSIPRHNYSGLLGRFEPSKPIHRHELAPVLSEYYRLCTPHLRRWLIDERFGSASQQIVDTFFDVHEGGHVLTFKKHLATDDAIARHLLIAGEDRRSWLDLSSAEQQSRMRTFRQLQSLVANQCLIHDDGAGPDAFFPTCHMKSTPSYQRFSNKELLDQLWEQYYYRRQNWRANGLRNLQVLQSSANMMICAEDLGMVPSEVYAVLEELGILGLRIQRWPGIGKFGAPTAYTYLTVASTSCHDCSTVRAWWQEDRGRAHELFWMFFGEQGGSPPWDCSEWMSQRIVEQHLRAGSMWTILPLQDYLDCWGCLRSADPHKDQINYPGRSYAEGSWRWRMPHTIETLMQAREFTQWLANCIRQCGRDHTY